MTRTDDAPPPVRVIIPAHDESAVIVRTLDAILGTWPPARPIEILVVCNGCSDETASKARAFAPAVEVIEIDSASKTGAINTGLTRARPGPVIIIDADILIDPASLLAIDETLRDDTVLAASPVAVMETAHSHPLVRAYYRVWAAHPWLKRGIGGSGVYGLSATGRSQVGPLPAVLADDAFVRETLPIERQRRLGGDAERPVRSIVRAPRTVSGLIACEMRWQAGNRQLRRARPAPRRSETDLAPPAGQRVSPIDRLVFLGIKMIARARLLAAPNGETIWWRADRLRDEGTGKSRVQA